MQWPVALPGCANDCDRSLGRQLECRQVKAENLESSAPSVAAATEGVASLPSVIVTYRVGVQPGKLEQKHGGFGLNSAYDI